MQASFLFKIWTRTLWVGLMFPAWMYAQAPTLTLSGYVKHAESGETLTGATVYLPDLKKGTYTVEDGFFSLTLPATGDSTLLSVSFVGFETLERTLFLQQSQTLALELQPKVTALEEVEILDEGPGAVLNTAQMSVDQIQVAEARRLPAFLGEVDIIKTLQLKPGVSAGGEGSSGIYVRGGGPDQNLVLLDGMPVYNPSHLFGFFSTFNSDAVKAVKLYKGGFPPQYGGRLSSVLDVSLLDGNRKAWSGHGGLGLISSRFTLEGPIDKEKGALLLSGRRTYVDLFTRAINQANADKPDYNPIPDYYFYDLNAKFHTDLGENDRLTVSGYWGKDRFNFNNGDFDAAFFWGNGTGSIKWHHIFHPQLLMNVQAGVSAYSYDITNAFDEFSFQLGSDILDYSLTADMLYVPNPVHTLRWGGSLIRHQFEVGRLDGGSSDGNVQFESGETYRGTEWGAYISDEFSPGPRFSLQGGLRLSGFESQGKTYWGLEPRISSRWSLNDRGVLKASYAYMSQYLHLVANSSATLPTDVWYPSTPGVPPQRSHQVALGTTWLLKQGTWQLGYEVYYKWLHNQVDFRDAANLFVNDDLESEFVFGEGYAYGQEFSVEKTAGRLTGWIGYTWAWSWRRFDGSWRGDAATPTDAINGGEAFHPRNDRRHDLAVVALYQINRRLSAGMSWEYRTGNATTLPAGRYLQRDVDLNLLTTVPVFQERNSFRMPAYHKLDLSLKYTFYPKWGESDLTLSVYNAYNRRNPYFIYIDEIEAEDSQIPLGFQAKQVALFSIIPALTYNFSF